MRFRRIFPLGVCLASCVAAVAVQAQKGAVGVPQAPRKVPAATKANEEGAVLVRGDNSVTDVDSQTSKLTGNVSVRQEGEDFILHCQSLIYNDPKKQARANTGLNILTTDSTITGKRLEGDFNAKILTLYDNIVISTHGKKDGIKGSSQNAGLRQQFASKPSKIFCNRVDWDYESRQGVLTGNIKMTQGKNSGTCDRIEFDEERNIATLKGHVVFTDEKGQTYSTGELTIYNNDNTIETGTSTLKFKPSANATPRPPKRVAPPRTPPKISEAEKKDFGITTPIPAFKPDPTPTPEPTPEPEAPDDTPPANRE